MGRVQLAKVKNSVRRRRADDVVPSLSKLIAIPALAPVFDADWAENGHLDAAVEHVKAWLDARGIEGARTDVVRLPGRSPVLLFDVPATEGAEDKGTVLMYGHLDKQPPVGGWSEGLGPWTPVLRDGRLYGRGSADDGYAGYAATVALEALRAAGGSHARIVVLLGSVGIRQPRPARLPRSPERPARPGLPRRLPRLGRQRLLTTLADHQSAGVGPGPRHRASTRHRAAFGPGQRCGAQFVPGAAGIARPHRGRRKRHRHGRAMPRRDPGQPDRRGAGHGGLGARLLHRFLPPARLHPAGRGRRVNCC